MLGIVLLAYAQVCISAWRWQHSNIHIDTTKNRNYFFRYWSDEVQSDGSI